MKIIVPMTGLGKRFVEAGYKDLKPLIKVHGMPIIEYVTKLFPGEEDIIFVCREDALADIANLRTTLERIAPKSKIVGIEGHKLGPVYAVSKVFDLIDDDEQVIVNYCDFFMNWDYADFKKTVIETGCDGAIPCYTGFHPSLIPEKNLYAGCKIDADKYLLEIKEKYSYTENKFESEHSAGTYYFKKGSYVKKYFQELMDRKMALNGEYYVSMVYELLIEAGLKTLIYDKVPQFCQWGTPEDFSDYLYWSGIFENIARLSPAIESSANKLIPMAGAGSRFVEEGYTTPKPLLEVLSKPMVVQAMDALPGAGNEIFICRDFHITDYQIDTKLKQYYPEAKIIQVSELTQGQASTCLLAKDLINNNEELVIGASDNGMIYDAVMFESMKQDYDALVFSFRNNQCVVAKPQQYGWIKTNGTDVIAVSVKKAISDNPINDHAIVGSFWFKQGSLFVAAAEAMIKADTRINNEFYVDEAINNLVAMGKKVGVFEIDYYICWGTPNDYRSFEYWQQFFAESDFHSYKR